MFIQRRQSVRPELVEVTPILTLLTLPRLVTAVVRAAILSCTHLTVRQEKPMLTKAQLERHG